MGSLNFNSINLASNDPHTLAAFYGGVFEMEPTMEDGEWIGFSVGNTFLGICPHDKVKGKSQEPERIMMNYETDDVQAEFDRIQSLGAHVVAQPYEMAGMEGFWIATFADPDGNYFQLMSPWNG